MSLEKKDIGRLTCFLAAGILDQSNRKILGLNGHLTDVSGPGNRRGYKISNQRGAILESYFALNFSEGMVSDEVSKACICKGVRHILHSGKIEYDDVGLRKPNLHFLEAKVVCVISIRKEGSENVEHLENVLHDISLSTS